MSEIVVREAVGVGDVELVRGLMREYGEYLKDRAHDPCYGAAICVDGYEAELEGLPGAYVAPGVLLLAMVDGEAAGCVALKALHGEYEGGLELKRLWVGNGLRGLGLGKKLMQAAIDHARGVGAEAVYLDTVPAAMPDANRLYAAMGFAATERYNENPVEDVVFFRLGL